MSHGDDPYSRLAKSYTFPVERLLFGQGKFDEWFSGGLLSFGGDNGENVGRNVAEVALEVLPERLLQYHCSDTQAANSHARSSVFKVFQKWYSVEELEAKQLWERIEAKIPDWAVVKG